MNYYITTTLKTDFQTALTLTKEALKDEGFGVLSEINIQEKFKEKLNVDFQKYTILGACNPPLGHEALTAENKAGVMLPCNVILQEIKPGIIEVASIDPFTSMQIIDNDELSRIAKQVKDKLENVIYTLEGETEN